MPDRSSPPVGSDSRSRRRRLILAAAAAAVVAAAVVPLPSYVVRWKVLPRLRESFQGRLAIEDWSAGWFGGVTLRGVRLTDPAGAELLAVDTLKAPLSPLRALAGQSALGRATATGTRLHLVVLPDGATNLDSLLPSPSPPLDLDAAVSQATLVLPGGLTLPFSAGRIAVAPGSPPVVDLQSPAAGRLALTGESLELDNLLLQTPAFSTRVTGQLTCASDRARRRATLRGTLRADELSVPVAAGDVLRLHKLSLPLDLAWTPTRVTVGQATLETADGKLTVTGDFAPASLANLLHNRPPGDAGKVRASLFVTELGSVAGQLPHALKLARDVRVTAGRVAQDLDLSWTAAEVTFSTKGDVAASGRNGGREVAIAPVTFSVAGRARPSSAGGPPDLTSVVASVDSAFMTLEAKADSLAAVRATGRLSLDRLAEQAGQFVDLGGLAAAGTGTFEVRTDGDLSGRAVGVRTAVMLEGVKVSRGEGTRPASGAAKRGARGRVIVDEPHLAFTAATQFDRTRPAPLERVREIDVHLQSRSGTVDAAGPSLAALSVSADLDLSKVREQVGTVIDLGPVRAAGRAKVAASTQGDVADATSPLKAKVTATVAGFSLAGVPNVPPIDGAAVAVESAATVVRRSADGTPARLTDATTSLTLGDAADPALALSITGDLDLRTFASPRFDLSRLTADLPRLLHDFPALAAPLRARVAKGRLTATAAGSWDGTTLTLDKPATVQLTDLSAGPAGVSDDGLPVRGESLALTTAGMVTFGANPSASLAPLTLVSTTHLLDLSLDPAHPLVFNNSSTTGTLSFSADLARLAGVTQSAAPPLGPQARLEGKTILSAADDGSQSVDADLRFTHVTAPPYFADAPIHLATRSTLKGAAVDFTGSVETPLGSAKLTSGRYLLKSPDGRPTAGWLDGLVHLDLAADVPDFPALYAAIAPASPLSVAAGKLTTRATVTRANQTTTARLTDFKVAGLSLRAGAQTVADGDLALAATVTVDTTATGQPAAVRVADLRASLGGLVDVTLPDPVSVTDLSAPQPTVAGTVRAAGRLDPAWKVAAALLDFPAAPAAVGGDYVLTQKLSTVAGKVHLAGNVAATDVRLTRDKETLLAEASAELTNDLDLDQTTRTVAANALKVTLASGAASAQATGRLIDWQAGRQLDQVHVDVDYDWAKLWPAVQPWLPPEYRVKDLKLGGQHRSGFDVRGSVPPAGTPALRTLAASGTIAVASADYGTYSVRDLTLPLLLQNGALRTVYPDGRTAAPAKFNGGTLDPSDVTLDLAGPTVRVTVPRNKVVLTDVKVDVPLANDLLAKVCPLFVGTREADGKVSVTVADCTNLDPQELFNAGASMRGQRLELVVSAADLRVQSMLTDTLQPLVEPGAFSATGTIRDGHLLVQDGQVLDDLTVQLAPQGFEVGLKGTIRLSDRTLMPLTAVLPKKMLPAVRNAGPGAAANLPEKIEIQFDGTADRPQPRMDSLTRMIQDAAAKAQTAPTPAPH